MFKITNFTLSYSKYIKRTISSSCYLLQQKKHDKLIKQIQITPELDQLLNETEDKILFNSVIARKKLLFSHRSQKVLHNILEKQQKQYENTLKHSKPLPSSLKYYMDKSEIQVTKQNDIENLMSETQFPFEKSNVVVGELKVSEEVPTEIQVDEKFEKVPPNWMSDYEVFNEDVDSAETEGWKMNYGTPDPTSKVSDTPCGGCGSLLHCKDTAIPGYIPSEIFTNVSKRELASVICQRCHFLKNYNTALQVRVTPDEYPKILSQIKSQHALVILMVDMLDFPCSIWPNIIDIIGHKRPVIVVGNKVDLLPQDSRRYLEHMKTVLEKIVNESGIAKANIKHTSLISAKTGFGIEELITKLQNIWEYKGDVYLVGCTNVGKSTLFNALLQSDYCKIQAVDLVQRATTSIWPGTTLNLLKFPILRPSGWRMYVRTKRLISQRKDELAEKELRKSQLRETRNPMYASLIGHIGRTFTPEEPVSNKEDPFNVEAKSRTGSENKILNDKEITYAASRWCFDTPGVVQPDQILHLLTTNELMLTLPKQIIDPKTFNLKPGMSIFIAGLARLDILESEYPNRPLRFTVFASNQLPVTVCLTKDADDLYEKLLGSELFAVPENKSSRLNKWPKLSSSNEMTIVGKDWKYSSADIILSSAGWIAVTPGPESKCKLKAWTPKSRGIYIRQPALLPQSVNLRGKRVRGSPAYKAGKFF